MYFAGRGFTRSVRLAHPLWLTSRNSSVSGNRFRLLNESEGRRLPTRGIFGRHLGALISFRLKASFLCCRSFAGVLAIMGDPRLVYLGEFAFVIFAKAFIQLDAQVEADKHANRQPRTVNPVTLAVTLGVGGFVPQNEREAAPASKWEMDYLLAVGVDTSVIKNSGEAQALISKTRYRELHGLASPRQLQQLMLRFGIPEDKAVLMKAGQAGAIIGRTVAGWR